MTTTPTQVVFLAEAWGEEEAKLQRPLVGTSGQELYRMLHQTNFEGTEPLPYNFVSPYSQAKRWQTFPHPLVNVFDLRPPDNEVETLYATQKDGQPLATHLPPRAFGPTKKWLLQEHAHHIEDLYEFLAETRPNLIVALGVTAIWALGLGSKINSVRGSIYNTPYGKVLPTYHPAAVVRKWNLRTTAISDLYKTHRECQYPEIRRTKRLIWARPTLEDLYTWWDQHGRSAPCISFDIETSHKTQLSDLSFASSPTCALHVPFFIEHKEGTKTRIENWWRTTAEETAALDFVRMVCESPIPKIGHNILQYDLFWMLKVYGIRVRNVQTDTIIKAHAWQPELRRNLKHLGSIFLNEMDWKHLRNDEDKETTE